MTESDWRLQLLVKDQRIATLELEVRRLRDMLIAQMQPDVSHD